MSDPFAAGVRGAAAALLPVRALLRRDRGDALYVTDAPRLAPDVDWQARFEAAGFVCDIRSGLARLSPGAGWMRDLTARYPEPPDPLCLSLSRFDGPPDGASLRLFAAGLKALDAGRCDPAYDRALRQRAAVCLRKGPPSGGGLYACALIRHLMKGECEI